jgi:hypothetical protein
VPSQVEAKTGDKSSASSFARQRADATTATISHRRQQLRQE